MADVGSGAGLPGLPLALVRPDLRVVLVEPLLRRATFLAEAVAALGLGDRVEVLRGRAEDVRRSPVDVVTARAVAPLDRLAGWTLPLARVGGPLLALKGDGAAEEVDASLAALEKVGGGHAEVLRAAREWSTRPRPWCGWSGSPPDDGGSRWRHPRRGTGLGWPPATPAGRRPQHRPGWAAQRRRRTASGLAGPATTSGRAA